MPINHFKPDKTTLEESIYFLPGFDEILYNAFENKKPPQVLREARFGDSVLNLIIDECVAKFAIKTGFVNAVGDKRKSNAYLNDVGKLLDFKKIYPKQIKAKNATCFECLIFHLYQNFGYDKVRDFIIYLILNDNMNKIYSASFEQSTNHLNIIGVSVAKFCLIKYLYEIYDLIGFKTVTFAAIMRQTMQRLHENRCYWTGQLIQSKKIQSQIESSNGNANGSAVELGLYFVQRGDIRVSSLFMQYIDMNIEYQIPKPLYNPKILVK